MVDLYLLKLYHMADVFDSLLIVPEKPASVMV